MKLLGAGVTREVSPAGALVRGFAAGFAATLALSALARVLPGMANEPRKKGRAPALPPPEDPFDNAQVERWQARSQSPAAYQRPEGEEKGPGGGPAQALEQPTAPGPEGLAEQFAFKVGAGLFDRDVAPYRKEAGLATHLLYGSFWGAVFGTLQSSFHWPRHLCGGLYGFGVYLIGPGLLVPAMKLMGRPWEEPPVRTAMMIGGHIMYGLALAEVYDTLERQ